MKTGAIYQIVCLGNGMVYYGQTKHPALRFSQHLKELRAGRHFNPILSRCYYKYGENSLVYSIIEYCSDDLLDAREIYWLSKAFENTPSKVINICREAVKPPPPSPQHMEMLQRLAKGRPCQPETREKISKAQKGILFSDERKEKLRKGHWSKKPNAEEVRRKLSNAQKERFAREGAKELLATQQKTARERRT